MARMATGSVVEPNGKQRSWAIRFTAYGKRRFVSLGRPEDGWTRARAEAELRHVLADVERGLWKAREPVSPPPSADAPGFHEFASQWLSGRRGGLRPRTIADYEWALSQPGNRRSFARRLSDAFYPTTQDDPEGLKPNFATSCRLALERTGQIPGQ